MKYKKIEINPVDYLNVTRNSISTEKPVLEFIDNSMQYASGKTISVVFNQKEDSIWIIDNGLGFHDISWQKFHQPFDKPDNSNGMSMFGVGSKSFVAIANKRTVYSKGKDREYSSYWDYDKAPGIWKDNYSDTTVDRAKKHMKSIKTGTVVVLQDLSEQEGFENFADFFKNIVEISKKRYGYKLFKDKTCLEFKFISTSGDKEEVKIKENDISKENAGKKEFEDSSLEGVSIKTFVANSARGVGKQGIDIYYDDFLLETIPFKTNGVKKRFINYQSHNSLNFLRQQVFLTAKSKKFTKIDPYKSNVQLEAELLEILVVDFQKVKSWADKAQRKKTEDALNQNEQIIVSISDSDGEFDKTPNRPFKFNDEGVTYNKDSQFFSWMEKLSDKNFDVIKTLFEQLELARSNFSDDRAVIQTFLKHFSNNFETEMKRLQKK